MITFSITERGADGVEFEHLRVNSCEGIEPAKISELLSIIYRPAKKTRSDKGTTRAPKSDAQTQLPSV